MDGYHLPSSETMSRSRAIYRGLDIALPPRRLRALKRWLPFLICVMLPTLLGGVYYLGFASDQYISEARFVVRSPGHSAGGGSMLSSLLQGSGVSRSSDDTYAVNDYLQSRDALAELVKSADLRAVYARSDADGLARFPPVWSHASNVEKLYKYYENHVDVVLDSTTGVTTMKIRTFRPDDSRNVAQALLAAGESLVNRLNQRAETNAIRDSQREVERSEGRLRDIEARIAAFRNKETVIDPGKQSQTMLLGVADLEKQLAATQTYISQLAHTSPGSPLLQSAHRRADALGAEIQTQQNRVTGSDASMVPRITLFDELQTEREFAIRALTSSTTSLEAARVNAERQQLYLDRVVEPNLPDYPLYPHRLASLAVIFASFLGIYLIGRMLIAGMQEHKAH